MVLVARVAGGVAWIAWLLVAGGLSQAGAQAARPRANHAAQIKVAGPAGIRVNTWSGNLHLPLSLGSVTGRGPSMALVLSYNSGARSVATPYGFGWQLSHEVYYASESNGDVSIVWGNGRVDRFVRRGLGWLPPIGSFDMLREHQPGAYVLRSRDGVERFFDAPSHKHVTVARDANGNTLTFDYDAEGRLSEIHDAAGRTTRLVFAADRLAEIVDAAARRFEFLHDARGDLVEVRDALGVIGRFSYDGEHFLTGVEDAGGLRTTVSYRDGAVARLEAGPLVKILTYDLVHRVTTVADRLPGKERTARLSYDATGRIVQVQRPTDGLGGLEILSFRWSPASRLVARTDPLGRETTYTYDSRGRPLSVTDPSGGVATYRYEDAFDRLVSATDAAGRTVSFAYDARGNLVGHTNAAGDSYTFEVDARGDLLRVVDPVGAASAFTYDAVGNLASVTNPSGQRLLFSHDSAGNVVSTTDNAGATVSFRYDGRDRQVAVVDPLGATTAFDYDAAGRLVRRSEPGGRVTEHRYDTLGRLVRTIDPLGGVTAYGYDPAGRLVRIRDAAGRATSFGYDLLDRLISRTDPLGGVVRFTYDAAGNLVERSDERGVKRLAYDLLDRVVAVDYPGTAEDAQFTYDAAGNRTVESNAHVTVTSTFDTLSRPLRVRIALSGVEKVSTSTYDHAGRRIARTDPDGGESRYEYDASGRLTSLIAPGGLITRFTYDASGRLAVKELPNNTAATFERDAAGRLTTLRHRKGDGGVLWSYRYEHDAAGDLVGVTDEAGGVSTYAYDAARRLTAASYPDGSSQAFTYDPVGNRLALTDGTGVVDSSYDAGDRLLRAGPVTYEWNAAGSLVRREGPAGATEYTYDLEGRLLRVVPPTGGATTLSYYPDGRRLRRVDGQGRATLYFYDGASLILETDAQGARLARYNGAGLDDWVSLERDGNTLYYHQDGLGSTIGFTDGAGQVVARYAYEAFGGLRESSGAVANPMLFTGKWRDEASGFYLFRYRAYDPETGRFTTPDLLPGARHEPLSLHGYLYVRDDPVGLVDPLGLFPSGGFGGFGGFGGGFGGPLDLYPPGSPPLPPPGATIRLEDLPPLAVTDRLPIDPQTNDPLLYKLPPSRRYRLEWGVFNSGGGTSSSESFILESSVGAFGHPLYDVFTSSGDASKAPQSGDFHPTVERCPCSGGIPPWLAREIFRPMGSAGLDLEALLAAVITAKGGDELLARPGGGSGACSSCPFGSGGTAPPAALPPRFTLTTSVSGEGEILAGDRSDLRGCCSRHDGVCGCDGGRVACCDGDLSPSCDCRQIGCPGDCSESYPQGQRVSLNAVAARGWRFVRWTGACAGQPVLCRLTMTRNLAVSATFRRSFSRAASRTPDGESCKPLR